MAVERLVPNFVSLVSGWTGTIADIDEDPDTPDTAWFTGTVNTSPFAEIQFAEPVGTLIGNQEFRLLFRKNGGSSACTATVEVRNNGSVVATPVSGVSITSTTGQIVSFTVDASLFTSNGMNVSLYITTVGGGGSPGARSVVELGALEWNATTVDTIQKAGSDTSSIAIADASSILKIDSTVGSDTASLAVSETSQVTVLQYETKNLYLGGEFTPTGEYKLLTTSGSGATIGTSVWGAGDSNFNYWSLGDPLAPDGRVAHSSGALPTTIYAWLDTDTNYEGKRIQSAISGVYYFHGSQFFGTAEVELNIRVWKYNTSSQQFTQIGITALSNAIMLTDTEQLYTATYSIPVSTPVDFGANDKLAIEFVVGETSASALSTQWNGVMDDRTRLTVDIYPQAAPADPITGSDTSSVAISETVDLFISEDVNASDTGAISVSETTDTFSDGTASDSSSLAVTESSSLLIDDTKSASDSATMSIAESTATFSDGTASDTASLSIAETAQVLETSDIAVTDTSTAAISESASIFSDGVTADAASMAVAETVDLQSTTSVSDTTSLAVTETVDSLVDQPVSDTSSLSVTESASVLVLAEIIAGDSGSLSISEATQQDVALQSDDAVTLAVTDDSASFRTIDVSDTVSLAITETAGTFFDAPGSDAGALIITETSEVIVSGDFPISGVETAQLAVSETVEVVVDVAASDAASLVVTETTDITGTIIEKSASDSASLAITDTSSLLMNDGRDGADSASLIVTEQVELFKDISVSDTVSLSLNDTSVQDIAIQRADSVTLSVSESIQSDLTIDATDSDTLTVTEEFDAFVIIDVDETGAVSISETSGVVQDAIAPAVVRGYSGGQFHVGIVKVYKNGAWVAVPLKVSRSETWT